MEGRADQAICECCKSLTTDNNEFLLQDLEQSASRGRCPLCRVFYAVLHSALPQHSSLLTYVQIFRDYAAGQSIWIHIFGLDLGYGMYIFDLYTLRKYDRLPWSHFATSQPFSVDTRSTDSIQLIRSWMDDCTSLHTLCSDTYGSMRPRRLLEIIGSPEDCVLFLRDNASGEGFAALSHCWGSRQPITTSKDNLNDHKQGIEWTDLPKTFQDAVYLCVQLDIRFIWIDSLCIIQDERSDWANESVKMAAVYESAIIVISAARAADDSEGLFSHDLQYQHTLVPIEVHTEDAPGQILYRRRLKQDPHSAYSHFSFHEASPILGQKARFDNPLLSRAWAMQERLFARRIVHFGLSELVWECRTSARCQCAGSKVFLDRPSPKSEFDKVMTGQQRKEGTQVWWQLVLHYAARKLTYDTDRLAALAGTARQLAVMYGTELGAYYAGMWESDLLPSLLWYARDCLVRPREYIAPTWSWASVTSGVARVYGIQLDRHLEIISASCEYLDELGYARCSTGRVVLQGLLVNARCSRRYTPCDRGLDSEDDSDGDVSDVRDDYYYRRDNGYNICGETFDVDVLPRFSLDGQAVGCLVIGRNSELHYETGKPVNTYWCLALKPEPDSSEKIYTRVGRCQIPARVVEEEGTLETVTLI